MQGLTDIIQQEFIRLVPASTLADVSCFVFYDNHPRDEKCIDITVCTKNGEIREYFQRDLISSLSLEASAAPKEIIIYRNSCSQLFYLVGTTNELFIVSSLQILQVHTKITNVDKFTVDDFSCNGQTLLKVTKKDDAVPIIFDENFKSGELFPSTTRLESFPLFSDLKRKYIEAQHSVKNHEKLVSDYIKLRHASTLRAYQNIHPNSDAKLKKTANVYGTLKVKTQKPWVKVCNKKILIVLKVLNEYKEPIEDIHMMLNSATLDSLTYTTKLFDYTNTLPFWKERSQKLLPNNKAAVVAIISLDEIKPSVASRLVLKGALSYKTLDKTLLLPFEDVIISSLATLGDEFDALSSNKYDADTLIAVISTTEKRDLRMRHINHDGETLIELLVKYLQLERIGPDVLVYNKSPYHALNGSMLHFSGGTDKSAIVSAYTRTKSQLLALIHCINDAVPSKIIITPSNYIISAKTPELSMFSEPIPEDSRKDYSGYATTVLNRTKTILEYLDWSMVKMSESKNPEVLQQIGFKIDMYACGKSGYHEFRDKMIEEAKKGVKCLTGQSESNEEPMVID